MKNDELKSVKINIGSSMYSRFADLLNTVPHVLAEFIDNALQSYYNNESALRSQDDNYKLVVNIDIDWDPLTSKAKKIVIRDNAAGINRHNYEKAFMPAMTPEDDSGLNEFGMGLKTAALWLGRKWEVRTKALGENVERSLFFDLSSVTTDNLNELPVNYLEKKEDEHYTVVTITDTTKNAPSKRSMNRIITDIASIYRKSLRSKEMQVYVCGEMLEFIEYPVLVAPPAHNLSEPPITWKKNVDFSFGKYKAKGFIGILRNIDGQKNGFVLLRRGRVIVGAEKESRYFPKMSGSSGTFRYKRLFGELELEGFDVSFNKNAIQDKENLEALMDALKGEIRQPGFDLLKQADDYRLNENQKTINKLVKRHDSTKKGVSPISINTKTKKSDSLGLQSLLNKDDQLQLALQPEIVLGETTDEYLIDGKKYKLNVEFVNIGNELFWSDISKKTDGIITCKINTEHSFFRHFGMPSESVTAIIKTLVVSKLAAKLSGNDTTAELFDFFNEFIKQTKV